ncbi:hypothetical protein ACT7DJ_07210 [Bacillus cereus]
MAKRKPLNISIDLPGMRKRKIQSLFKIRHMVM